MNDGITDPKLIALQDQLRSLQPAATSMSEAEVMYRCGWEAALAAHQSTTEEPAAQAAVPSLDATDPPTLARNVLGHGQTLRPFLGGLSAGLVVALGIAVWLRAPLVNDLGPLAGDGSTANSSELSNSELGSREAAQREVTGGDFGQADDMQLANTQDALGTPTAMEPAEQVPALAKTTLASPAWWFAELLPTPLNTSVERESTALSPAARHSWGGAVKMRYVSETHQVSADGSEPLADPGDTSSTNPTLGRLLMDFGNEDVF